MPKTDDEGSGAQVAVAAEEQEGALRAFEFHGVDLAGRGSQRHAECPFCGKEGGKWSVHEDTGLWQCKVCMTDGNPLEFLRQLWKVALGGTSSADHKELAADRGFCSQDTALFWELARSPLTGEWLVPGFGADGKLRQLYRRVKMRDAKKGWGWRLLPTPGVWPDGEVHALHGVNLYRDEAATVYVCEGWADGLALWELLRQAKPVGEGGKLAHTANERSSLLADACVLAVPGAGIWKDAWWPLVAGKRVVLLYDNDLPRMANGQQVLGAGHLGMRRFSELAARTEQPPDKVECLFWGGRREESEDTWSTDLPTGHDVRDALSAAGADAPSRLPALSALLSHVGPIPASWVAGRSKAARAKGAVELECKACSSWRELVNAWRLAMTWTEGLDRALSCMLASIASVNVLGDQLWLKIVSPASTGKTELCEALSVNRAYVYANSKMKGFHSSWKQGSDEDQDHSLIPKLSGKTLIIKDGDTLLASPQKDVILSEGRDLYDTVARNTSLNGLRDREYNVRMTMLLCGTESLRSIDKSELGERMLDVVIMEGIDPVLESSINRRKFWQVVRNRSVEANGTAQSHDDEAKVDAKRLTGGYVSYLRENVIRLMAGVDVGEDQAAVFDDLAVFVATMRARPSDKQDESVGREMSPRLLVQLTRLALCLAVVLNKRSLDAEVMRRVVHTAFDTARGKSMRIIERLALVGEEGLSIGGLAAQTSQPEDRQRKLCNFLAQLGAVEVFEVKTTGMTSRRRWKLTEQMAGLWSRVSALRPASESLAAGGKKW